MAWASNYIQPLWPWRQNIASAIKVIRGQKTSISGDEVGEVVGEDKYSHHPASGTPSLSGTNWFLHRISKFFFLQIFYILLKHILLHKMSKFKHYRIFQKFTNALRWAKVTCKSAVWPIFAGSKPISTNIC